MKILSIAISLSLFLALTSRLPLRAQTATNAPADSNAQAANPTPTGQAPDELTRKIAELVHASKYTEAQQLTTGLLLAYPDDQRLIKAKALLETLLAPVAPGSATLGSSQPANNGASAQLAASRNAVQLTGMDKVEYNSLIELARQAQQTTDIGQQKAALKQFMDRSSAFLQKYPDQMLLWQLRAASALSLDDLMAGYEAGQKLLAAGAADSNDPNLEQLLSRLNLKGWLDKQKVEDYKKYGGLLGTWSVSWSVNDMDGGTGKTLFSKSDSGNIEVGWLNEDGTKVVKLFMRGTVLNSGGISWEINFPATDANGSPLYPSGWQPLILPEIDNNKKTMKVLIPNQGHSNSKKKIEQTSREDPWIYIFTKTGG